LSVVYFVIPKAMATPKFPPPMMCIFMMLSLKT
jgi:hypothetical protein